MSKGKLVVLAVIAALIAAFFIFDLRQYLSLEYFKASRATIEAYRDSHPLQAALGVAIVALGIPLYMLVFRARISRNRNLTHDLDSHDSIARGGREAPLGD